MLKYLLLLLLTVGASAQTPDEVAGKLYAWLTKTGDQAQKHLNEVQSYLTPELYDQLTRAYKIDPSTGNFLDFDPWSNTQMGADKYACGKARLTGALAKVPITVSVTGGGTQRYTCVLTRSGSTWQVANLVYAPNFNLLSVLKELNKAP